MNILVIGEKRHYEACVKKFGNDHLCTLLENRQEASAYLGNQDVVFDATINQDSEQMLIYKNVGSTVFLDTTYVTLQTFKEMLPCPTKGTFFGFCSIPIFMERYLLEVVMDQEEDQEKLSNICQALGTDYATVASRVGMVTPRVICMIINEAFFALEDQLATPEDIDTGAKLGVRYPYGPFEWCDKIGVREVYRVLKAVEQATQNPRYKVSSLLEQRALQIN